MEQVGTTTLAQLKKKMTTGTYVLFFSADWCPDCQFIKPFMPAIENDFANMTFLAVDRDENMDLAKELDIFGIPSFVVFQDGQERGRFVNKDRKTKEQVEKFLTSFTK